MMRAGARGGRIIVVRDGAVASTPRHRLLRQIVRGGFAGRCSQASVGDTWSTRCSARRSASISKRGRRYKEGHRNHMRAINIVNRAGGIRQAGGAARAEVRHHVELVTHGVEYVLAGSIRDDGPLVDTLMDLIDAQTAYAESGPTEARDHDLDDADGIGVGTCAVVGPVVCVESIRRWYKVARCGSSQTIAMSPTSPLPAQLAERLRG